MDTAVTSRIPNAWFHHAHIQEQSLWERRVDSIRTSTTASPFQNRIDRHRRPHTRCVELRFGQAQIDIEPPPDTSPTISFFRKASSGSSYFAPRAIGMMSSGIRTKINCLDEESAFAFIEVVIIPKMPRIVNRSFLISPEFSRGRAILRIHDAEHQLGLARRSRSSRGKRRWPWRSCRATWSVPPR